MAEQSFTIAQTAKILKVSTRTVRRFIKAGKLKATLQPGPFGEEYRISELPQATPQPAVGSDPEQTGVHVQPIQPMDIIRELQEKNLALAAQLGAASERIHHLESELKLLAAPKRLSWWQRLFKHTGS
jgi:MerR family copper efflux transcriptional regulator